MPASPCAVLLCKFSDDSSEPYPRQRYEQLFTPAGAGRFNMVDFFADMSHGQLDLGGSKVFGWYTLPKKKSDYAGSGINPQGRQDLINWARAAAAEDVPDFSVYKPVVVCTNVSIDLFGGPGGVVCDARAPSPSLLGQEMGHAYGLDHSRAAGSGADCNDPFDTMSTAGWPTMGNHPVFTELDAQGQPLFQVGPGLNAANMWSMDWLDPSRVWSADAEEYGTTVELRPLHRHDLAGYLVARVGEFFFELRLPERWDSGIAEAMVLVHTFSDGHSHLHREHVPTGPGEALRIARQSLLAGSRFQVGDESDPLGRLIQVHVAAIDPQARTATLIVRRHVDRHPKAGPALGIGPGVWTDAGGLVIVGGKLVRIPPRSPLLETLSDLATLAESESLRQGVLRDGLQRQLLQAISSRMDAQRSRMSLFREPSIRREVGSAGADKSSA
ncbi:MAG: hypothetical protein ACREXG_01405 [Polaromonas sp.]